MKATRHEPNTAWLWNWIIILAVGLGVVLLAKRIFITIPSGHRGVMFDRFGQGTVIERSWPEGFYVIAPWNKLTTYESRLQSRAVKVRVPSVEGLDMALSVSLRFRPNVETLGALHKDIGPDYFERLIFPEVDAHLRRILGKHGAQEIYTGSREIFEEIARVPLIGRLTRDEPRSASGKQRAEEPPYVFLEELRVLSIERPKVVADAVAEKQRQEQLSLEYKFRLQREQQEAERKRIEAAALRDYNQVAGQLSPELLRLRSIEATLELAKSNNAKVVVVGGTQTALPMMLNLGEQGLPDSVPAARSSTRPARESGATSSKKE